jgi:hypothetical protein
MQTTTRLNPGFVPPHMNRLAVKPTWPAFSLGLLLVLSAVFPPLYLTVMNLALIGLALVLWAVTGAKMDREVGIMVVPFAVILMCGAVMGIGTERYLYLKDAWYIANPVIVMLTGFLLARFGQSTRAALRAFVICGVIISFWQLRAFVMKPEVLLLPADVIRATIGTGHYSPVLAFIILCTYFGRWRSGLGFPNWLCWAFGAITFTAVVGSFSRTEFFIVFIGLVAAYGGFARREFVRVGLPVLALVAATLVLGLYVDHDSDRALNTFFGKLARTGQELFIDGYNDLRSININYRGYETAIALEGYWKGSPLQILFGRGLGYMVDLGVYLPLDINEAGGRSNVRFVSVLHNGYLFILVKTGLAAVAAYLYFLWAIYMKGRRVAVNAAESFKERPARILQAGAVTLLATTYVTSGAFNKSDMFPFLLIMGYLLYVVSQPSEQTP